MKMTK